MLALPIKKEFVVLPDTPISEAIAQVTAATWTSDLRQQRSAAAAGITCEPRSECEGFPDISAKAWLILLYAFTCIRAEAQRFREEPSRKVHIISTDAMKICGLVSERGEFQTFIRYFWTTLIHCRFEWSEQAGKEKVRREFVPLENAVINDDGSLSADFTTAFYDYLDGLMENSSTIRVPAAFWTLPARSSHTNIAAREIWLAVHLISRYSRGRPEHACTTSAYTLTNAAKHLMDVDTAIGKAAEAVIRGLDGLQKHKVLSGWTDTTPGLRDTCPAKWCGRGSRIWYRVAGVPRRGKEFYSYADNKYI